MVIGDGLIANAFSSFRHRNEIVIFASGVSNSREERLEPYKREKALICECLKAQNDKMFVYFSTCSIEDPDLNRSSYVIHKIEIEKMIRENQKNYLIFRLPQIVGNSANKNTLMNFVFDKIKNGLEFDVWENAIRFVIDIDDVRKIITCIIDNKMFQNQIVNIASRPYKIIDIVESFENMLGKKAKYVLKKKGAFYKIDCSNLESLFKTLHIEFGQNYLANVIQKYYSNV